MTGTLGQKNGKRPRAYKAPVETRDRTLKGGRCEALRCSHWIRATLRYITFSRLFLQYVDPVQYICLKCLGPKAPWLIAHQCSGNRLHQRHARDEPSAFEASRPLSDTLMASTGVTGAMGAG